MSRLLSVTGHPRCPARTHDGGGRGRSRATEFSGLHTAGCPCRIGSRHDTAGTLAVAAPTTAGSSSRWSASGAPARRGPCPHPGPTGSATATSRATATAASTCCTTTSTTATRSAPAALGLDPAHGARHPGPVLVQPRLPAAGARVTVDGAPPAFARPGATSCGSRPATSSPWARRSGSRSATPATRAGDLARREQLAGRRATRSSP